MEKRKSDYYTKVTDRGYQPNKRVHTIGHYRM